jgi:DNA-binding beta-propeller fold protein YncE
MPICNSTILLFDRRAREIARLYTGNGSVPRAVAAGPHGSILFSDDMDPSHLKQIARNGSIVRTWKSPLEHGLLLSVHYDNSTQTAWVVDYANAALLQWPLFHDAQVKVWNLTAIYGQLIAPWAAVVDPLHKQLIVSAGTRSASAAWVLWLDLTGQPLYNFSFPLSPGLPFVLATGVALSPDSSRVYATDMIAGAVYVFDNEQRGGQLPSLQQVHRIAPRKAPIVSSE